MDFKNYLQINTNYSSRTVYDIANRVDRVKKILQIKEIDNNTINLLEKNNYFNTLSYSVRSQLRKSIKLYIEYKGVKND